MGRELNKKQKMLNAHALAVVLCVKMISSKIKKIFIVDVDKITHQNKHLTFCYLFYKNKRTSHFPLLTHNLQWRRQRSAKQHRL